MDPKHFFLNSLRLALGLVLFQSLAWASTPTAILVDKKTNTLRVAEYAVPEYKILETYHVTMGSVIGDKEEEGDLKTPEGVYFFNNFLTPPHLKPKFGAMAFHMNYPNEFDTLAGRTGFDIMLHATNEPDRLKKNYDSQGCIVVRNEEIAKIKPYIHLGLTPILVFAELTDTFLKPESDGATVQFFKNWIKGWEDRNLDVYIGGYHTDFHADGKNKDQWRDYKGNLNKKYQSIKVQPENVHFYRHPKYAIIQFTQNYESILRGGAPGFKSRGTKVLVVAEEKGEPRIIAERYTPQTW